MVGLGCSIYCSSCLSLFVSSFIYLFTNQIQKSTDSTMTPGSLSIIKKKKIPTCTNKPIPCNRQHNQWCSTSILLHGLGEQLQFWRLLEWHGQRRYYARWQVPKQRRHASWLSIDDVWFREPQTVNSAWSYWWKKAKGDRQFFK